ncbi:MAG: methylated-DNA--[protein]-cysteine S-methyltransferase [Bellilinea sp.]
MPDLGTINYEARHLEKTQVGPITIYVSDAGLARIEFGLMGEVRTGDSKLEQLAALALQELTEYFFAGRRSFSLPIDWRGMNAYQELVLRACYAIPYGQTRTYGELAKQTGKGAAGARAVGSIMASNPIPIVIPCHRVVGTDGKLHGYGSPGGVDDKARLLALEGQRIVA